MSMQLWFVRMLRLLPWIRTEALSPTVRKMTCDRSPGWAKYVFDVPFALNRPDLMAIVELFLKKRGMDFHRHSEKGDLEITLPCPICPFNAPPKVSIESDGDGRLRLMLHIPTVGLSAWIPNGEEPPPSWDPFVRDLDKVLWGME